MDTDSNDNNVAAVHTNPDETALVPFLVFVSYRVSPDQGFASALKELIESSIEPAPRVFVSGDGGLRPANIGFKPQIQAAAQSARAFVAVITQDSRDREWIFFEAGAAWGRNQLYVPLLINTSPSDLSSSIADYQAIKADSKEEVLRLVESIAQAVGGKAKNRFGTRYRTFTSRIQSHLTAVETLEEGEQDDLEHAVSLLHRGDLESAKLSFTELEDSAISADEKSRIRSTFIANSNLSNHEALLRIAAMEAEHGTTAVSQFWTGFYQYRPSESIKCYNQCLSASGIADDDLLRTKATVELAKALFRISDHSAAYSTIRSAIIDPCRQLRTDCTLAWLKLKHEPEPSSLEELLLLCTALPDAPDSPAILRRLIDICSNNGWKDLLVHFAHRLSPDTGGTANYIGRAYSNADLKSLAYLAFSKAAELGASVGLVNMARATKANSVPAVGLKLLQSHVGEYDSADPGAPYAIRGELERIIQAERELAKNRSTAGGRLFEALANFGWVAANGTQRWQGNFNVASSKWELKNSSAGILFGPENSEIQVTPIGSAILFLTRQVGSVTHFLATTKSGCLVQLEADLKDARVKPVTTTFPQFEPVI